KHQNINSFSTRRSSYLKTKQQMKKVGLPIGILLWSLLACVFVGCKKESDPIGNLVLSQVFVGENAISLEHPEENIDLPLDRSISLTFSIPIDQQSAIGAIQLRQGSENIPVERAFVAQGTQVLLHPIGPLLPNT